MNLQNFKDKLADQPAKKTCDIVPLPCVASVKLTWLETNRFQKNRHMQDILCNFVGRTMYFKYLFIFLTKALYVYAYIIYVHSICIIQHYIAYKRLY